MHLSIILQFISSRKKKKKHLKNFNVYQINFVNVFAVDTNTHKIIYIYELNLTITIHRYLE